MNYDNPWGPPVEKVKPPSQKEIEERIEKTNRELFPENYPETRNKTLPTSSLCGNPLMVFSGIYLEMRGIMSDRASSKAERIAAADVALKASQAQVSFLETFPTALDDYLETLDIERENE